MRHAFSLIEVLIAMALGLIILVTVYAGFRVSTQTVLVCNRLSIENRLLTAGMARALDEADFWTRFDRPGWEPCRTTPTKQIRGETGGYDPDGRDSRQLAQPFTPFSASWTTAANELPSGQNVYTGEWLPHDPRTWYRGDGTLYLDNGWKAMDCRYGDYGLFSGVDATVSHRGSTAPVGIAGPEIATWYASQQKALKAALGFYGWWDYVPANALLDWYDRDAAGRAIRPYEMANRYSGTGSTDDNGAFMKVGSIGRFARWANTPWPSGTERVVTRSSFLWEQVLGICAPRPAIGTTPADDVDQALRLNRWMGGMRWVGWEYQGAFNLLTKELSRPEPLVVQRPQGWPQVTWDVRRYRMYSRCVTDCFIRVFDPLSAKTVEINFRTVGTTLRGARLQRRHPASPGDHTKSLDG